MEQQLRQRLASQIARGQLVLFTGAGFASDATNRLGQPLPSPQRLTELLWNVVFPEKEFDPDTRLADIFEVAVSRAHNEVKRVFHEHLIVSHESLPDSYRLWFSVPWAKVYTLNVDNLDEAVNRRFPSERPLRSVSALTDEVSLIEDLPSIHLNGRVDDFPALTFSDRQFAERTAVPDPWYRIFIGDLLARPVLFVGTSLDEPPLWHHLELRNPRTRGSTEMRPGSYLVTPHLPPARAAMLERYNINLVEMEAASFAEQVLAELGAASTRGFETLRRPRPRFTAPPIDRVSEVRSQRIEDAREFLMGREPEWADITEGYAVERSFDEELIRQVSEGNARAIVVTGTAGAGRSTALKRLALALEGAGNDCAWVNLPTELPLRTLREEIRESPSLVIFVDDLDLFRETAASFVADVLADRDDVRLIAGVRSSRLGELDLQARLNGEEYLELAVPHLEDQDIELLLDALTKANRLGRLNGMSSDEQVEVFRKEAGRQLLVAMIEATSGQLFDDKVNDECSDLGPERGLVYAAVAIAHRQHQFLTRDEIALALGEMMSDPLGALQGLLNSHLLVEREGRIRVRHRVIARKAVDFFKRQGLTAPAVKGLLFVFAAKAYEGQPWQSRERRILVGLLNHEFFIEVVPSQAAAREAYDVVEDLLRTDYHYWLQRGSYELQVGDVFIAKNFLEQARGLAGDDYKVQTAWAYMILKRACHDPTSADSRAQVEEALVELEDAISRRGQSDSYPYHVLGSQGLAWARRGALGREERVRLLERLLNSVREGRKYHPKQADLEQLENDIEYEYLMMGTSER